MNKKKDKKRRAITALGIGGDESAMRVSVRVRVSVGVGVA